jgi:acetate kinase
LTHQWTYSPRRFMMGTRSGSLDRLLLHFIAKRTPYSDVDFKILNKESGLLGVSGVSSMTVTFQQQRLTAISELPCSRDALLSDCAVFGSSTLHSRL